MEKEYITIREFADLSGVSVQAVYKKTKQKNNPIKPYLKRFKNKLYISRKALEILSPAFENQEEKKSGSAGNSSEEKLISILERQIEELREQVNEKDLQLREKDVQINNLLNQVSESLTLLNQQQQLTALASQAPAKLPEAGERRNFWKRLFNKKETPGE